MSIKKGGSDMNKIYRCNTNIIKPGREYTAKYVPLQVLSSGGYCNEWKMKKDEEGNEYIEVYNWIDKIVKTENILEVRATWPVKILYRDPEDNEVKWLEVGMNHNQLYNLLHRDCTNYPYGHYGTTNNKKKEDNGILYEEELI